MLNKLNVKTAARLVAGLEDYQITPLDNSPVARLVSASVPVVAKPEGDIETVVHESSMRADAGGVVPHDLASEEVVEVLAAAVRQHFSFARNTVQTAINTIVSAVEDAESNVGMPNYSIVSLRPAAALDSPLLDDLIGHYTSETVNPFTLLKGMPDFETPKLMEMLRTGTPEFDQLIADLIAGHDAGWLCKLWKTFFQEGNAWDPSYDLKAADAYVIVHLWCRHLIDIAPDLVGYTLEEYKFHVAQLMAATGRTLTDILTSYERYESAGVVVLEYPSRLPYLSSVEDGEILVYGPAYDRFLQTPGAGPEVIFGAAIGNRPQMLDELVAGAAGYIQEYNAGYEAAVRRFNETQSVRLWSMIGAETSKYVAQCPVDILNPAYADPIADTQDAVNKYITEFSSIDITGKFYAQVRQVVAGVVFGHSNALRILTGIDARRELNPNESLMDSAYYVARDLICEHFVSQNKIVKL